MGRDIVEALRRVRERAASEGEESSPEIGETYSLASVWHWAGIWDDFLALTGE